MSSFNPSQFLSLQINKGCVSHAYLFVSSNKEARLKLAEDFINSLLCDNRRSEQKLSYCKTCENCRILKKNPELSINLIGEEKDIGINIIREIKRKVLLTPNASWNIVYIPESNLLTREASYAMLKILEEPPLKTIFILSSRDLSSLMPTLRSRLAIIHVPLNKEIVAEKNNEVGKILRAPLHERFKKARIISEEKDGASNFLTDSILVLESKLRDAALGDKKEVDIYNRCLTSACEALRLVEYSNTNTKLLLDKFFTSCNDINI